MPTHIANGDPHCLPCHARHYIVFCPRDIILLTSDGKLLIICPMDRISQIQESRLKAAIYVRVSTADQRVESQLYDLREFASGVSSKAAKWGQFKTGQRKWPGTVRCCTRS